jgi:hypothetical protein
MLALLPHEIGQLGDDKSDFTRYLKLVTESMARVVVLIMIYGEGLSEDYISRVRKISPEALVLRIPLRSLNSQKDDPLNIRAEIAVKMLMNAHSTAVMTKMGRVVGNTMTNVRAGNLKLIGRATYLTKLHVDDVLKRGAHKLQLKEDAH